MLLPSLVLSFYSHFPFFNLSTHFYNISSSQHSLNSSRWPSHVKKINPSHPLSMINIQTGHISREKQYLAISNQGYSSEVVCTGNRNLQKFTHKTLLIFFWWWCYLKNIQTTKNLLQKTLRVAVHWVPEKLIPGSLWLYSLITAPWASRCHISIITCNTFPNGVIFCLGWNY